MRTPEKPALTERLRTSFYEVVFDPILKTVRTLVASNIPNGSKVIDIGCGPGALSLELARQKQCSVHGIDLSQAKIARAIAKSTNISNLTFAEADATNLRHIPDKEYNYATMTLFLHAVPQEIRQQILQEAMRVANQVVIADYASPLPKTWRALAIKAVEHTGEHRQHFKSYQKAGGLNPLLANANLQISHKKLNPSKTVRIVVAN